MRKLFRVPATFMLLTAFVAACQETIPTQVSDASNDDVVEFDGATFSSVTDRVSLGGADICGAVGLPPGCDANFSLSARLYDDGSVRGQWQDTFVGGTGFIHVTVDCLNVVDNGAVLGGVITAGRGPGGTDLTGLRATTAVVDNGTSAKDPPDQMSFSFFPNDADCTTLSPSNFPLMDLTKGQVTVR